MLVPQLRRRVVFTVSHHCNSMHHLLRDYQIPYFDFHHRSLLVVKLAFVANSFTITEGDRFCLGKSACRGTPNATGIVRKKKKTRYIATISRLSYKRIRWTQMVVVL